MPIQKIGFTQGMDKDNDLRYLKDSYRDAFNVRITDYAGGNSLALTNVKGNSEISYSLPTGHNYTIGSYDDKLGKNVYYFIYNSKSNHSILKYDYTTNVVEKVLEGTALDFSLLYFITSVALLDNKYLIYTDNNKEPRWVDLSDLNKYGDPIIDGTLLDVAKAPQTIPAYSEYTTNAEKKYNNLVGKLWQFRTVYVYKDGTRSAFSTISKLALPSIDSQAPFVENQDVSLNNEIMVTVPSPPADVEKVEFYAQGVSDDAEKTTNWYLFNDELASDVRSNISNKYGINFADYYFANDGVYILADPLDVAQAQTYIPKKAKTLEILHGNRLGIANIIDGENIDDIDIECTLSFIRQDVPTTGIAGTIPEYYNTNTPDALIRVSNFNNGIIISNTTSVNGLSTTPTYDKITFPSAPNAFDKIEFTLRLTYNLFNSSGLVSTTSADYDFSYLVSATDIETTAAETKKNVAIGVANAINAVNTKQSGTGGIIAVKSGEEVFIIQGQNLAYISDSTSVTTSDIVGAITAVNITQISSLPSFKKDATHEFGIEYSDGKGRRSTVITNGQLKKRTPAINGLTSTSDRGRVTAQIEIYHTPPSWATSYSIMYSKNLSYDYFLYWIGEVTDESATDTNLWSVSLEDLYRFRIRNQGTDIAYQYQEGDIIQFIESVGGTYVKGDNPALSLLSETGVTESRKLYFNYDAASSATPLVTTAKYLFEIRRPAKTIEDKFFYEIGHTYDISGGFHEGNTQDQTASLPAIIDLDDVGDVYYKRRNFVGYSGVTSSEEFVESEYFSDYYDSKVTSIGRASVVDNNFKEINRKTTVVYSQQYIPETSKNGISTVYDSSLEQYDTTYGSIQHIFQDDRRLFVFQERKVGVVGVNQQFLLNGATQTYETATVLTPIQYYPAEYGIGTNPESFSVYGYRKYFVDTVRGSVLRLSQDGITPISDKNMRGFFNELFSMVDSQLVRLTYDKNNDELVVMHTQKDFQVNPSTSAETATSCTVQLDKSKFPQLDQVFAGQLCLYIKGTAEEGGTEYIQRTATISSVTSFSSTVWSVDLTFSSVSLINYSIQYLKKCDYNVTTFSEAAGVWVSRWNYKPDWMEECNVGMVSFKDGGIYKHDESNSRGTFYGTSYPATVTIVANENPSYPKMYKTIQQESTTQWECPTITTLESQSSNLLDTDFEEIQNQWFANFLFDTNTPNVTNAIINGDPLRSSAMQIKLQNDTTSAEKIFSVGVTYIISNLSNDE